MGKFRTSARSVDMLGRQQIAGIPTAVSEIFKNSYDAYAHAVRGDVFFDQRILVIRDDGVGMTPEDFVSRWLTVGTDSKSPGSSLPPVARPVGMQVRRQMGEKGIGRLAIASTGPQLLVASRSLGEIGSSKDCIVFALVQWTMFEIPGLTLDDVIVPIRRVEAVGDLTSTLLNGMADEVRAGIEKLSTRIPTAYRERIYDELDHLTFEPHHFVTMNGPSLSRGSGTAFIVSPVSPDVDSVMEPTERDDEFAVSEFQRFLLGFTNSINVSGDTPEFQTEFIRHSARGIEDVIDPGTYFWEEEDFDLTDHLIEGQFDADGSFSGSLSIYGAEPVNIREPWKGSKGRPTACGPFGIKFGYVQGQASESRLQPSDFTQMTRRLEKIGGLYVYRDGIRVLPYGNSDKDYLEIEKRRSLNAATYYFSYRRMFGAIDLSSEQNRLLQEKAGREGFRENQAYRDFLNVLQGFLIQLAANNFSSKAATAEEWRAERQRIKERSPGVLERERKERIARQRLLATVQDRLSFLERGRLEEQLERVRDEIRSHSVGAGSGLSVDVTELEDRVREQVKEIREFLLVERPPELAVSREEERTLSSYGVLLQDAAERIQAFALEVDALLADTALTHSRGGDREELIQGRVRRIQAQGEQLDLEMQSSVESVRASVTAFAEAISSELRDREELMRSDVELLRGDSQSFSFADESAIGAELEAIYHRHQTALQELAWRVQEAHRQSDTAIENVSLKEQVIDLREQIDANVEILQLGQAVQVVSHEFEASIRSVRQGLQSLAPWARSTPRLKPVVRDLRASFAHLDGYLRLFTPLQRRLYRESIVLTGSEIRGFLNGVFGERLAREGVRISFTDSFDAWAVKGFPSTFYPVFVNLIDNAIYWASSGANHDAQIVVDSDGTSASVSDNGPGVPERDREFVFERGFGRRPGGRGIGLSLARDLLARDGWDLVLENDLVGTTFRITDAGGLKDVE